MTRNFDCTRFSTQHNPNDLPDTIVVINKTDSGRNNGDGGNTFQYDPRAHFINEYSSLLGEPPSFGPRRQSSGWNRKNEGGRYRPSNNFIPDNYNASIYPNKQY